MRYTVLVSTFCFFVASAFAQSIVINGIDVKTTAKAMTRDTIGAGVPADESTLVLVQFSGPTKPEWLEALSAAGATIHHYVADYSYFVTMKPASFDAVKSASGVVWIGREPASAKISATLRGKIAALSAKTSDSKIKLVVLSYGEDAAKKIESSGIAIRSLRKTQMGWHETRVVVPLSKISGIAAIDSVFHVEEVVVEQRGGERAAQAAAGQYEANAAAPFGPGYMAWLGAEGLSGGDNITVHVMDDGLDQGIATNLPGTAHADIVGRIAGVFNATSDPDGSCRTGHGQIDASIIMGNATVGTVDKGGYLLGQGVAPLASVYATKIFRDEVDGTDIGTHTYTELTQFAQNAGAIFANHSWGAAVNGAYTASSAEFDALVRDSDPSQVGNQQTTHFFCAGNDGPNAGTTWSNANAKNVISVGSHENSDADGYDGGTSGPTAADNIRDVYITSSRGPTDDGRLGVTVVATGTHVQGAASTADGYTGAHVSSKYWPPNQTDYARSTGTSHASPVACGAGIVVYEMFRDQLFAFGHTNAPSPALIRAVLTNTAEDLYGGSDGDGGTLSNIPNPDQGWGAVNLETLASMKTSLYSIDQSHVFTASGQDFEITLAPMIAGIPMKITLAWTDAPGVPGAGTELVNDLDLRVIQDGQTYKGNVFTKGASTTGGNADRKNTLEAVFLNAPSGEPVTVRVTGFNIAGDGVPNSGSALDQDFALFAWNAGEPSSTGNLRISSGEINCDGEVSVTLRDQDLAATVLASVTVTSSTGDVENLLLAETDSSTGMFVNSFATSGGTPASNGLVEVAHDGTVTVTYNDANNENGQQTTDEDVATVDCTPPTVTDVDVSNITSTSALITYTTNGPCDSEVLFGTACGSLTQFRGGGLHAVSHFAHLTGLTRETTYRFKIEATDGAGNKKIQDDGGGCFSFDTTARPDYFSDWFFDDNFNVENQSLTFTPNNSISKYEACRVEVTQFPTDPASHTNLTSTVGLKNDDSYEVTLTGGKLVAIYGETYSGFFINANGSVTFGTGDSTAIESLYSHEALPRVSGVFDDLEPTNNKPIRYAQLADRAVITWVGVPKNGIGGSNSFQIELFFDGKIKLTHLAIGAENAITGLSRGLGLQTDYSYSDLTSYPDCNVAQTGSVRVKIKPKGARQDGARWRLDGGAWTKHNKSISGVSVGNHTVEFKPIAGWQEPNDKQVNVSANNESALSGKYTSDR